MLILLVGLWLQTSGLSSSIRFPNSGAQEAQTFFLNGVLALHNFFYEEAIRNFREAQKLDPNFALAYWGEAMSCNDRTGRIDLQAGRAALSKFAATRRARLEKTPTRREKLYMEAVEALYGEGDALVRDTAHMEAMKQLWQEHPNDIEAASFYALSLLGVVRPDDSGFRWQMTAASILERILKQSPNHPGAVHYLIHAYDDPQHASLGLGAAKTYSKIAANAPHALHMPAHIFVQLGMWKEAAESNAAAYKASETWAKSNRLSESEYDFHSLMWLQYAHLQQGQYAASKELMETVRRIAQKTKHAGVKQMAALMAARYVVETQRWDEAVGDGGEDELTLTETFMRGLAAANRKDLSLAERMLVRVRAVRMRSEREGRYGAKQVAIMEKEMMAAIAVSMMRQDEALQLAKEAAAIESTLNPPQGPPEPMKPAHEFYGELLLQLNKPREALVQFQETLRRMPKRAMSLSGASRAYAAIGDKVNFERMRSALRTAWTAADAELLKQF